MDGTPFSQGILSKVVPELHLSWPSHHSTRPGALGAAASDSADPLAICPWMHFPCRKMGLLVRGGVIWGLGSVDQAFE